MGRLLTWKCLENAKGHPYSRKHTDRLEARGQFPRRYKLGPNRVAWDEDEYDAWVRSRRQARDGTEAT